MAVYPEVRARVDPETVAASGKSERGEDVHKARDAADLFRPLGFQSVYSDLFDE